MSVAIVAVMMGLMYVFKRRIDVQFDSHARLRATDTDAWCDLPIQLRTVSAEQRVGIVAPSGSGVTNLKNVLQTATRLVVADFECKTIVCTGDFFFDKAFAVVFENVDDTRRVPYWKPTHTVALWRNPIHTIADAWKERCGWKECDDDVVRKAFGRDYADTLLTFYNQTAESFVVFHEDIVKDMESVAERVLEYIRPTDCGTLKNMIRCVIRSGHVVNTMYADTKKELCDLFRPVWRPQWGDTC